MLEEAARFYRDPAEKSIAECFRAAEQRAVNKGWRVWKQGAVRKFIKTDAGGGSMLQEIRAGQIQ